MKNLVVVAGAELAAALEAEAEKLVRKVGDRRESESLCAFQRRVANRGILEAEILESAYGWSVRYVSGLQNWGLIFSSRRGEVNGSFRHALDRARAWAAEAPGKRIVWAPPAQAAGAAAGAALEERYPWGYNSNDDGP